MGAAAAPEVVQETPALSLRERLARRLRPPRRIRFTTQGTWLILLTLGVGFAALNTGNNLLYLVLGMMLTVIGASGILSELSVGGLNVERHLPEEIHAGRPVSVTLTLSNGKRVLPAIGIRVFEEGVDIDTEPAYFVHTAAGEPSRRVVRYTFRRRGHHPLAPPFVETSYPFGLFRRGYRAGSPRDVLVFPEVGPVTLEDRWLFSGGGGQEVHRKGRGEEFFGLRAFAEGDDVRSIHWKVSAKRARLMVRESAEQARRLVILRFEPGGAPDWAAFEAGVCRAASLAKALLEQDFEVGWEGPGERFPPGVGRSQLRRILTSLAVIAPGEGEVPPPGAGQELRLVVRIQGTQIVVGAMP